MIVGGGRGFCLPHTPKRILLLFPLALFLVYVYLSYLPFFRHQFLERLVPSTLPPSTSAIDVAAYPYPQDSKISVNLVIATTHNDDISWTSRLRIPNLNIIRYVSDNPLAKYHPPVAKGREALMYFTYLHDFYDGLPDVSIFIHPHETAWHVDGALRGSMLFSLSRLDFNQVLVRHYVNLRVSWENACPDWINTTKRVDESSKKEEPFMRDAFAANFGPDVQAPEILAGPCCSQFAVTRDAVHRRPRSQYKRSMDWLIETDWSDYIVGRTWEHMWPWLFREKATDCPVEWKTLCRMYGVCFDGPSELQYYQNLWNEKVALKEKTEFWQELMDPRGAEHARGRMRDIDGILDASLAAALETGKDESVRGERLGDIFVP